MGNQGNPKPTWGTTIFEFRKAASENTTILGWSNHPFGRKSKGKNKEAQTNQLGSMVPRLVPEATNPPGACYIFCRQRIEGLERELAEAERTYNLERAGQIKRGSPERELTGSSRGEKGGVATL